MLNWIIKSQSIAGKMNRDRNIECQDKTYSVQHEDFACIALADGASCSEYGGIGAQVAVETVCEFMEKRFDYLFELNEEEIKYHVLCSVLRKLRKIIIERDIKLNNLASTLLFTAVKGDRYISMLLGDGMISKNQKEHYEYLIYSETRSTYKKKYLTSSPMCYLNAYVNKGNVGDIEGFFMCSDGLSDKVNIKDSDELKNSIDNIMEKIYLFHKDEKNIYKQMEDNIWIDDCSYITLYKNQNI